MSLNHILLGMLKQPSSGYDLGKQFSDGPIHFWSAELSQIYPALRRMTQRGWLSCAPEQSERGPQRIVYTRTSEGTTEMAKWLSGGPILRTERYAHIGQLIYMGELDDLEVTRDFLTQLLQYYEGKAGLLEDAAKEYKDRHPTDPTVLDTDEFHNLLSVQFGAETFRARVRACRKALKLIEARKIREIEDD